MALNITTRWNKIYREKCCKSSQWKTAGIPARESILALRVLH